ncbi:uncharacterized protein BT62DRAFT_302796 [Guyanagaster necrorhizus]|uniref:Uncharacterized protein n=1 Tax=Guyanagaster necrorhizus TaxID=856835 RepID=A0A9P8AQH3_9AGAR|nr:uncharacterized protein BT62DRAFT_302796 [Guyanagaster necrorhizus MCA 3950]KAG7443856.1 hypothetical protein BT62DRAFT_302796 [Guyanagaster necrorhizus MCA 3950]
MQSISAATILAYKGSVIIFRYPLGASTVDPQFAEDMEHSKPDRNAKTNGNREEAEELCEVGCIVDEEEDKHKNVTKALEQCIIAFLIIHDDDGFYLCSLLGKMKERMLNPPLIISEMIFQGAFRSRLSSDPRLFSRIRLVLVPALSDPFSLIV